MYFLNASHMQLLLTFYGVNLFGNTLKIGNTLLKLYIITLKHQNYSITHYKLMFFVYCCL